MKKLSIKDAIFFSFLFLLLFAKMASSSDNESENSTEEIAAPTRRTRSGRAAAPKPGRRGKRRGGAPTRSTRTTRKSARIQHEEVEEEEEEEEEEEAVDEVDQGQVGEGDDDFGLGSMPDDDIECETSTVPPVFDLSEDQFQLPDEFHMEENSEAENALKADTIELFAKTVEAAAEESASSDEIEQEKQAADSDSEQEETAVAEEPPDAVVKEEDAEMADDSSDQEEESQPEPEQAEEAEEEEDNDNEEEKMDTSVPVEAQSESSKDESPPSIKEEYSPEKEEQDSEDMQPEEQQQEQEEAVEAEQSLPAQTEPTVKQEVLENVVTVKEEAPIEEETVQPKEEIKQSPVKEKKRKRRGFSDAPSTDSEPPSKKQIKGGKPTMNGDKQDEATMDKAELRRKKLPELGKYWKAVKDDSSDFTGWTYLLQYVDQESDVEAAREAYDAFLSLYPYCYGYWRKYADYEKKKGSPEFCDQVFERGLRAIPLSVDLWLHYLNHVKANHPDDESSVRKQFEKALDACGMEFRSDRLWESYIKWETENKNLQNVTAIYDRLLATPTQGYTGHFDNFETLAKSTLPQKLLSIDEFLELRKEWLSKRQEEEKDDEPKEEDVEQKQKEEISALREKIIESRKEIHKITVGAVADRWTFEEGIKRPYFHVKPLEKSQIRNWREYLDYEIEQGNRQRIIVLFERCLIACALYEEFWVRFLTYLEDQKVDSLVDKIRQVYERACTIHHVKKANLHLHWAAFEEKEKNWEKAANILENLEKQMPSLLQLAYRRINLERRRGDLSKASALYESYVSSFKNQTISTNLAIKHARFFHKIKDDLPGAIAVLNKALEKDKANSRLFLQLIDMNMSREPFDVTAVTAVFDRFLASEASPTHKATFAQRKVEFLEDFGQDIEMVLKAQEETQQLQKLSKESRNRDNHDGKSSDTNTASSKKGKDWTPPIPSVPPPSHSGSQYGAQSGSGSQGYSGQSGSYPPYGPQQQGYPPAGYNQFSGQGSNNSSDQNNYYQNWNNYQGGYQGGQGGWGQYNYY